MCYSFIFLVFLSFLCVHANIYICYAFIESHSFSESYIDIGALLRPTTTWVQQSNMTVILFRRENNGLFKRTGNIFTNSSLIKCNNNRILFGFIELSAAMVMDWERNVSSVHWRFGLLFCQQMGEQTQTSTWIQSICVRMRVCVWMCVCINVSNLVMLMMYVPNGICCVIT